jgi:hypothetical protein
MISTRRRDTVVDTKHQDHEGAILGSSNAGPQRVVWGVENSRGVGVEVCKKFWKEVGV